MISFGVGDMSLYEIIGGGVVYWVIYSVAVAIFLACSVEAYLKVFRKKKVKVEKSE